MRFQCSYAVAQQAGASPQRARHFAGGLERDVATGNGYGQQQLESRVLPLEPLLVARLVLGLLPVRVEEDDVGGLVGRVHGAYDEADVVAAREHAREAARRLEVSGDVGE